MQAAFPILRPRKMIRMKPITLARSASRWHTRAATGHRLNTMERRIEDQERLDTPHRAAVLESGDEPEDEAKAVCALTPHPPQSKTSRPLLALEEHDSIWSSAVAAGEWGWYRFGSARSALSCCEKRTATPFCISPLSKRCLWLFAYFGVLIRLFVATAAEFEAPIVFESPNPKREGWFGTAVSSVPDVNGDGRPDILVGAPGEISGGYSAVGRAYLYDGTSRKLLRELRSPNESPWSGLGSAGIGIADVNGDGRGDVVLGTGGGERRVYVFNGATGDVIHTLEPAGGPFSSTSIRDVSTIPDVSGDGRTDIAIGTISSDGSLSGAVKIYDGASGAELKSISGELFFGDSVSGIPDLNGDAHGDVIVGAWMAGEAYIYDGATGELLRTLVGNHGFGLVIGLGDVNGDNRGDVVVSGPADDAAAVSFIFDGANGTLLHTLSAPDNPAYFGRVLNRLPDVNGDGRDDVVVATPNPTESPANAYVFSGATGELLAKLPGHSGNSYRDVAGLPDVNGDGLGEVLVANRFGKSKSGIYQAGQVLLYLSKSLKPPSLVPLGWTDAGFKLRLSGEVGAKFELQRSEDLVNWATILNQTQANQTTEFLDPDAKNARQRFYRTHTLQ